jgi:protein-S-isoprenylcysteine O-methyltransferase Ste14
VGRPVGGAAIAAGIALLVPSSWQLRRHLTPLPKPQPDAELVQDGVFGLVRHPLYAGTILTLLGVGLASGRLTRMAIALGAIAFYDAKASREEVWLLEQFPAYAAYRVRTGKLIPRLG